MPQSTRRPPRPTKGAATSPPPRWRRRPELRPAQILDAALVEFGENGLGRTRLEDIARRAGVAKGTIYLYFPTKDDLFRAMVRHTVGRHIDSFETRAAAIHHGGAAQQLHEYVTEVWEVVRGPVFPILHRLTTGELHDFPELMRFFMEETATRALAATAAIVRRGVAKREFRRVDPDAAARMIHAVLIKHAVWCAHRAQVPFVARTTDAQLLREMLDFIDHALRPTPHARPRRRKTA